jgi:hypothetical protein
MKGTLVFLGVTVLGVVAFGQNATTPVVESQRALVTEYCAGCHNEKVKSGGFSWTEIDLAHPERNAERIEKVIRKVRSGMMPPAGARRPEASRLKSFAAGLETAVDQAAARQPFIDAPDLHRVNRTEYRNSVRDLLGIDVDVTELLPPDARSGAFDNMADALTITPALMQGYARAAEKISREAVGDREASPGMTTYNVPRVVNQMRHVEGTPFGTRGGISVLHTFPADGEYKFNLSFHFWFTGNIIGSKLPKALENQEIEVSIDGERAAIFKINLEMQEAEGPVISDPIKVKAGQHRVSAAFVSNFDGPIQDQYRLVEHTLVSTDIANHPQMTALPHLQTFSITGPFNVSGVSDTPSRRRIFSCRPNSPKDEETCATQIISRVARQAFRRPVAAEDMESLMVQYQAGRSEGDFETGVRTAIQSILADPEFVFRFERVPRNVKPGQSYRISDLELAARLSYFLWSSAPDEQLISLASQGKLKDAAVLDQQVKRMLSDPRSESLATNFARQWLRLQSIQDVVPEPTIFPEYSRSLGESMRREVELFFASVLREDRNILDLLTADYTYVDEVLARHYRLPIELGPRFRRVQLTDPNRFGLLGKAGILMMTSLANRTSPVARGKYVLEVLIGSPPPAPPPVVPKLKEAVENEKTLTVRERMEQHRANPACSGCHQMMDPIGLALENYDAVGVWRTRDSGAPINPSGVMFDGTKVEGPASVRQAILNRSESFVGSFTENLLAYGVGRVLDYRDMPTVRAIAQEAGKSNNRLSSFISGIVKSKPFQMRVVRGESVQQQ